MNKSMFVFAIVISGCGSDRDVSLSSIDSSLEGGYNLTGIECVGSDLKTTANATIGPTTYQSGIDIIDTKLNTYEKQNTCTSIESATITFTPDSKQILPDFNTGSMRISDRKVTNNTNSACIFDTVLANKTGLTISPNTQSITVEHNSAPATVQGIYLINKKTQVLSFISTHTTTSTSDTCLFLYTKQ